MYICVYMNIRHKTLNSLEKQHLEKMTYICITKYYI